MSDEKQDEFDLLALDVLGRVKKSADELREFCDSVVILATINEGDSSQLIYQQRRNHLAQEGSIRRMERILMIQEAQRDFKGEEEP